MSKGELSKAIAEAERRNPAIARQRERASDLAREKRFGKETVQQEEQWNRFAEEDRKSVV